MRLFRDALFTLTNNGAKAKQKKKRWDSETCAMLARHGCLAALEWAHDEGCDWNTVACTEAANGGHVDVLQWARANGCNWDSLPLPHQSTWLHALGYKSN